jgi:hypothetical protein
MFLGNFDAELSKEDISKLALGKESLHYTNKDSGFKAVNLAH